MDRMVIPREAASPRGLVVAVAVLLIVSLDGASLAADGAYGSFVGELIAKWLPDHRSMELTHPFAYVDQRGKRWDAPKGSVVDGASIPRVFWTAIGGPFEGAYRNASVVHDVACVERRQPWQEVHRMFYHAMRAAEVEQVKAALMYAAVYRFGPRWDKPKGFWGRVFGVFSTEHAMVMPPPAPPPPGSRPIDESDVQAFEKLIREKQPTSVEQIEELAASLSLTKPPE